MASHVNVANAQVTIYPGLVSGWHQSLQQQLNRQSGLNVQINPQVNNQQLNRGLGQTENRLSLVKTAAVAAFAALSVRGLKDKYDALSGLSNKLTEVSAGLTGAASLVGPLVGLVGGLGAGFAVAGAGVASFYALAKPQISAVTDAAKAATKAQDQYSAALATGNTAAAATAQKNLALATANLTPLQRTATQATLGLESAFKKQSNALAPLSLGVYTNGVKTLTGLLPSLTPIATAAGSALQSVFKSATAGLNGALSDSGRLGSFINVVGNQIGPVITTLAGTFVNLGRTISNVFQAAQPVMLPALNVLKQLTGELSTASSGSGLLDFFKQVAPLLTPLRAAITSIAAALGSLIQAALPLAGPVLAAINALGAALFNLFSSPAFGQFVKNISSAVQSLTPLFSQLVGPIGQVIATISGQFAALLPTLIPVIVQFANVFSNVLVGLSPLLPLFAQLIGILVSFLPILYPIIQALRAALAPILMAIGKVLIAIQPAIAAVIKAFLTLLPPISKLLVAIVPLVSVLVDALAPVLIALFDALQPLFPIITKIATLIANYFVKAFSMIAQALVPLLPVLSQLAEKLLTALLQVFQQLEPILIGNIKQFLSLLPVMLPLISAAVDLVVALLPLLPIFEKLTAASLPLLVGVLKIVAPLITALAVAFTWLVKVFVAAVSGIVNGALGLWHGITGIFGSIGRDVSAIWNGMWFVVKLVLVGAWNAISGFFTKTIAPGFRKLWQSLVDVAKSVWSGIASVFATPINVVLDIIGGFAHIVDNVTNAIGLGKPLGSLENIPHLGGSAPKPAFNRTAAVAERNIPGFSTGGFFPGYGGGDRNPVMLEDGEVALRKETVRKMGGPQKVHQQLNRDGGEGASAYGVMSGPNYGGLLGDIGNAIIHPSRIVSSVLDAGKWVLSEAAHLLRAGAANALDASFKALLAPVQAILGGTTPGKIALGGAQTVEKAIVSFIRGKEGSDGTAGGGPIAWNGGSNTISLIESLAGRLGVPDLPVTSTFRANAGYHGINEAVDFSNGPGYGPGSQTPGELAFDLAWAKKYGSSLAELIHAQPGAINIKDGKVVDGPSFYGASTMLDHWNHVHIAISPASIARGGGGEKIGVHGNGGIARGWSLVGDQGVPELIHAGSSSRVLSGADSIAALMRASGIGKQLDSMVSASASGSSPGLFTGANVTIGDNVDLDMARRRWDFEQRAKSGFTADD